MTILKRKCSSSINNQPIPPPPSPTHPISKTTTSNPSISPNFTIKIKKLTSPNNIKRKSNTLNPNPLWEPSYRPSTNSSALISMLRSLPFENYNPFPAFCLTYKTMLLILTPFPQHNSPDFK